MSLAIQISIWQSCPCVKTEFHKDADVTDKLAFAVPVRSGQAGSSDRDRRTAGDEADRIVVLAVGDMSHWRTSGRDLPWGSQITFADFSDITDELIATMSPDVVISPLLCRSFDCLDLAAALCGAGFRGRLRIMAPKLPRPEVVLGEARALCPKIDIDLILDQFLVSAQVN